MMACKALNGGSIGGLVHTMSSLLPVNWRWYEGNSFRGPVVASYGLIGTSRPVPRPPFEGGSFRPFNPVLNTGVDRTMLLLSGGRYVTRG